MRKPIPPLIDAPRNFPAGFTRYNWHRPHGGIKSQTPISRLGLTEDNLLRLHN